MMFRRITAAVDQFKCSLCGFRLGEINGGYVGETGCVCDQCISLLNNAVQNERIARENRLYAEHTRAMQELTAALLAAKGK